MKLLLVLVFLLGQQPSTEREFADRLSMRADFMLIRLDDEEFDAGIQPLRRERNDIAVVESIDYVVFQK